MGPVIAWSGQAASVSDFLCAHKKGLGGGCPCVQKQKSTLEFQFSRHALSTWLAPIC